MANDKIIVQLANPERKFVKVYHDFLHSELLTADEKIIFIALKSFIDFSQDVVAGTQGEVFPTIKTLQSMTGWGNKKVVNIIKELVKKGIVKKVQRGLTKSNIYILSDYATMWACDDIEELKEIAENQGVKHLTPEEHIEALERMGYKVQIKEKELASEPTKEQKQAINNTDLYKNDDTTNQPKSQEKYTIEQVKVFYDYEIMLIDRPAYKTDIDAVINILYDTLNTTKDTIRVQGEDKPAAVVISKLMKLDYLEIMYAIDKFSKQTERIKNPPAYMLTLLYNAKEQMNLDICNQVQHDMYHWEPPTE